MDAPVIGQLTSPSARYQSQRQQTVVHLARLQGKLGPRDELLQCVEDALVDEIRCLLLDQGREGRVEKRQSSLETGGQGVFACSAIPAGTLFALYAGIAYLATELPLLHALKPELLEGNEYLMSRWDETIVDGCPFGESGRLATSLTHDGRPSCPAAIGQFINHSNSDGNCIPISLDIKKSFLEICPYKPPVSVFSVGNAVARTDFVPAVAFVATRSIAAEEELLFNYNYRPSVDRTPSWYQR